MRRCSICKLSAVCITGQLAVIMYKRAHAAQKDAHLLADLPTYYRIEQRKVAAEKAVRRVCKELLSAAAPGCPKYQDYLDDKEDWQLRRRDRDV